MANISQSYLLEATVVPDKEWRTYDGVEIQAGPSWIEIKKPPYNVTSATKAYFSYAVCKCYFSGGETYVYPLKVNQIRLRYNGDSVFILFDEITPANNNVEIQFGLSLSEA